MLNPIYIGSAGAALILIAFILGQLHVWKDTYFEYDLINLVGSGLLIWYAWAGASWPFFILNLVWAAVSLRDCVSDLRRNAQKPNHLGIWDKWMH